MVGAAPFARWADSESWQTNKQTDRQTDRLRASGNNAPINVLPHYTFLVFVEVYVHKLALWPSNLIDTKHTYIHVLFEWFALNFGPVFDKKSWYTVISTVIWTILWDAVLCQGPEPHEYFPRFLPASTVQAVCSNAKLYYLICKWEMEKETDHRAVMHLCCIALVVFQRHNE